MTVYRDRTDPLTSKTYAEGYDLGMSDHAEGKPRRTSAPRNANASAGRLGYSDGYSDAAQRTSGPQWRTAIKPQIREQNP